MTFSTCVLHAALVLSSAALPEPAVVGNQLDAAIAESWKPLGISPAPLIEDGAFFRRVWLDLAGRVPPLAEARQFLESKSVSKRADAVDKLLASKEFANHWARLWAEYLIDKRPFAQDNYDGHVLQTYLRDALLAGKSYQRITTELLQGAGASDESGPANFLLRYGVQPEQLAGAVSKKFLGVTLQCAQCHDHPHAAWKQDDFWGLAAYFSRLRRMQPAENPDDDNFAIVVERSRGELTRPDPKGKPDAEGKIPEKTYYPRVPGAPAADTSDQRRQALIEWLTAPRNPYFSRHLVNRVWRQLLGAELVSSLDAPPSKTAVSTLETALLELLAADFAASDYDLKRLLRVIVLSSAYQRAAAPHRNPSLAQAKKEGKAADNKAAVENEQESAEFLETRHYARHRLRPLTADQIYLSMAQATGYRGNDQEARLAAMTDDDFTTDIPQDSLSADSLAVKRSLALLNGEQARAASEAAAAVSLRLYGKTPGAKHIEWMFLSLLTRKPNPAEMDALLEVASSGEDGLEDVAWVLLNSAEFVTNH